MAKLLRIRKPDMPVSFAIILILIFLETFSFNIMQAIIPLHTALNEEPTINVMAKTITNIPVTFAILEFIAMPVGAILIDLILSRQHTIILSLLIWNIVPMIYYLSQTPMVTVSMIWFMAIIRGFIQPVLLSLGALDYEVQELNKIYLYFMVTYCVYQFASFWAQTIVPIDIVENASCGSADCITQAVFISSIAAILACLICYWNYAYFAMENNDNLGTFKSELSNILRILFVFIPYAIFWIFYQYIILQINDLPKLINLFIISTNDIPRLYTALKCMVVVLYFYLAYKWFSEFILAHSGLMMTIGGISLGLYSIIAAPMVFEHKDQYSQVKPVKPDAIQISFLSSRIPSVYPYNTFRPLIDIPYFNSSFIVSGERIDYRINNEQAFMLRTNYECPHVWVNPKYDSGSEYCFTPGNRYLLNVCSEDLVFVVPDRAVRDSYGRSIVCVVLQNYKCADSGDQYVELYRNPTIEYEEARYSFYLVSQMKDYPIELNEHSRNSYSCQIVEPGIYRAQRQGCKQNQYYTIEAGAAYTIQVDSSGVIPFTMFVTVQPFKSTVLDTRLIPLFIIRVIGEFLLIINGFYFVFIQMDPKFRTIGITLWFMLIKFGAMVFEIQRSNSLYFRGDDLDKLGLNLIWMAILSLILQQFFNFKNGRDL